MLSTVFFCELLPNMAHYYVYPFRVRENKDIITVLNKVSWLDGKVFIILKAFEIGIALYIKYAFNKVFMMCNYVQY